MKKETLSSLSAKISGAIGYDIYGHDIQDFLESIQGLTEYEILLLLEAYKNLDTSELGGEQKQQARVSFIRFLVALFPRSLPVIESWLSRFEKPEDYEIHFTLFCYLDDIPHFGNASDSAEALRLSKNYLLNVRSNTGHAAWMAGDMLSDHWKAEESMPVLLRVAQKARFVAGRSTGLDGLELQLVGKSHALNSKFPQETKLSAEETATVRRVLRAIVRKERNPSVRREAERLLASV